MAGPFLSLPGAFLCCLIDLEMLFLWMCILNLSFLLVQVHRLGFAFKGAFKDEQRAKCPFGRGEVARMDGWGSLQI